MSFPFDRRSLKLFCGEWRWQDGGSEDGAVFPICTVDTHVRSCPYCPQVLHPSVPDKALCTCTPLSHSLSPDVIGNSHFPDLVQVLGLQISVYHLFLNLPVQRYFPNSSQKALSSEQSTCIWDEGRLADGWC